MGRDALIFIDQEGGRVQRLRPPHWNNYRAAKKFAELYKTAPNLARRAVYLQMRLIGDDLYKLGITADCAPVLDIPVDGADDIISDRAYGRDPKSVIPLAHAAIAGLSASGVAPVIKHIPGHGRATDAPMAMTAHAVYDALDPKQPVTISRKAIQTFIRNRFGFGGILMSDDLDMKALSGTLRERTEQSRRSRA